MKLEWLNKTYKFFQDRVDFWEELNPEEDDLSMFYPLQIDNPEDVNIPYQITRFYEQLRNSIKFKIDDIKKV